MGPFGAVGLDRGPSPGRRRGEPGVAEPALQGPLGGELVLGTLAPEHHADQARAPRRVLAAQAEGRRDDGRRRLRRRGTAVVIGGPDSGLAPASEAEDQRAHGAGGDAESPGDGRTILAVLMTPPDGSTHGHREGAGHGRTSLD
jgi:hypothetical protein